MLYCPNWFQCPSNMNKNSTLTNHATIVMIEIKILNFLDILTLIKSRKKGKFIENNFFILMYVRIKLTYNYSFRTLSVEIYLLGILLMMTLIK